MIQFFYNQEYNAVFEEIPVSDEASDLADTEHTAPGFVVQSPLYPLCVHAHAYAVADKYGVPNMEYALVNTTRLLTPGRDGVTFEWSDFFRGATVIWDNTPEVDNSLRKMYLATALTNRAIIVENEDDFRDSCNAAGFLKDLLIEEWKTNLHKNRSLDTVRHFKCTECPATSGEMKCRRCRGAKVAAYLKPAKGKNWVSNQSAGISELPSAQADEEK